MSLITDNTINKKYNVAIKSFYAAIAIVILKFAAYYVSGSIGILSEMFHSTTDLLATVATIFSIRFSSKPPDKNHNYGHEKIESFSALFQVFLLILMCAYLIYESIERIIYHQAVELNLFTFGVILFCIYIDYSRSRALKRVAKETKSQALEADALHFSSDILSSVVVLIGMIITYFNLSKLADPISAIIVSIIIIITTFGLSKTAINSLLDTVPKGLQEKIKEKVLGIKGIEGIKNLRIRSSGSKIFIDMIVYIGRTKLFSESHMILDKAEKEINSIVPHSDIVIHSEPIETDSETINEKIRMIINEEGFKCHDIYSHKINDDIITELHIEINITNDHNEAHDIVTKLESIIKEKIPIIKKIKIHIDEPSDIIYNTIDITEQSSDILYVIDDILKKEKSVIKHYDVTVIKTGNKIRVSLNCIFINELSFEKVHEEVTVIESKIFLKLKQINPNISNVIIHSEPEKSINDK